MKKNTQQEYSNKEYNNPSLIRRRFYLSKQSLAYIDYLALQQGVSASVLLDRILCAMRDKSKGK